MNEGTLDPFVVAPFIPLRHACKTSGNSVAHQEAKHAHVQVCCTCPGMTLCVQVAEGWDPCPGGTLTSGADNPGLSRELGYTGVAEG